MHLLGGVQIQIYNDDDERLRPAPSGVHTIFCMISDFSTELTLSFFCAASGTSVDFLGHGHGIATERHCLSDLIFAQ